MLPPCMPRFNKCIVLGIADRRAVMPHAEISQALSNASANEKISDTSFGLALPWRSADMF